MGDIYSLRISPKIRFVRSTDRFVVPFYKKEIARRSIPYLGSKIWNDLNQDIKDIKVFPGANSFKNALKFLQISINI